MPLFSQTCSSWENAYNELNSEQHQKLEYCLRYLLEDTEIGYVLFGNKPIYLGGFYNNLELHHVIFSGNTKEIFFNKFLISLLEELNLIGKRDNYFIQVQYNKSFNQNDDHNYILVINKRSFIEVVNKHLLLFQYILGPKVTAESLLDKISDPNETIFSALNNDVTLVGMGWVTEDLILALKLLMQE